MSRKYLLEKVKIFSKKYWVSKGQWAAKLQAVNIED